MVSERYGPTIDDLYEQELKARARQWEVRVEGDAIRRFADTPEGRVQADKLAMRLLEQPWVDRVEVVVIESAAPAEGREPRRASHEPNGESRVHPAESSAAAGSIRATVVPFSRIHRMQTRRVGLDEAMQTHPSAGGVQHANGGRCPVHPEQGAYDCFVCSDRRT